MIRQTILDDLKIWMLLIPLADAGHFYLHLLPRIKKGVQATASKQSQVKWCQVSQLGHKYQPWNGLKNDKVELGNHTLVLTLMIFDAQSQKLLGAPAPSSQEMQTAFHSSAKMQPRKESRAWWQALCQALCRASFRAAQVDSHLEAVPPDGLGVSTWHDLNLTAVSIKTAS